MVSVDQGIRSELGLAAVALPTAAGLGLLLGRDLGEPIPPHVAEALERAIVAPARALTERPSKAFRAQLVALGHGIAARVLATAASPLPVDRSPRLDRAAAAVELLHAGSLMVDDVEDDSGERRGGPAVHVLHGVPLALCSGNWLYFWPLRLLSDLGMPPVLELELHRRYALALEHAHYGQALDLKVKVDSVPQAEVPALCRAVSDLKTGALTALALEIGALMAVSEAPDFSVPKALAIVDALGQFGRAFGRALQALDDLGNLLGTVDPGKCQEDLRQRKPTAIWAMVAEVAPPAAYESWRATASRDRQQPGRVSDQLTALDIVGRCRQQVAMDMAASVAALGASLAVDVDGPELAELVSLMEVLKDAYG